MASDFHSRRFLQRWLLWEQKNQRNTGKIHTGVNECSQVHIIMTLSHYSCSHHWDYILLCWSPIEWRDGYCHCVWGFYSMIVVCIDYIGHKDFVSFQLSHFQVCIGTCKFFYFAFSGSTKDFEAPILQCYTLWNKGYQIYILCLWCFLISCYYTVHRDQP